jgi:hypothetical protein
MMSFNYFSLFPFSPCIVSNSVVLCWLLGLARAFSHESREERRGEHCTHHQQVGRPHGADQSTRVSGELTSVEQIDRTTRAHTLQHDDPSAPPDFELSLSAASRPTSRPRAD